MRGVHKTAPAYKVEIFIGGDYFDAMNICEIFCERGLCVTVEPTVYIFTGGRCNGVRVGLINYARFGASRDAIWATAWELALDLKEGFWGKVPSRCRMIPAPSFSAHARRMAGMGIIRVKVPSTWRDNPNGSHTAIADFKLGVGPCGKTVEVLECNFTVYGVEIVQVCTCTERKVFVYPWHTVTGRVEVTHG